MKKDGYGASLQKPFAIGVSKSGIGDRREGLFLVIIRGRGIEEDGVRGFLGQAGEIWGRGAGDLLAGY